MTQAQRVGHSPLHACAATRMSARVWHSRFAARRAARGHDTARADPLLSAMHLLPCCVPAMRVCGHAPLRPSAAVPARLPCTLRRRSVASESTHRSIRGSDGGENMPRLAHISAPTLTARSATSQLCPRSQHAPPLPISQPSSVLSLPPLTCAHCVCCLLNAPSPGDLPGQLSHGARLIVQRAAGRPRQPLRGATCDT